MSDLIRRQIAKYTFQQVCDDIQCQYCQMKEEDGTCRFEKWIDNLPSAERKSDEESELKFYYVESIDDYWIGRRLDNFYYADWNDKLGFVWSHSRYLPWGKHIISENTLWKEHTYPSEPVEIPFTTWIVGFMKKHSAERKGKWIPVREDAPMFSPYVCSVCGAICRDIQDRYCYKCGADMRGEEDD